MKLGLTAVPLRLARPIEGDTAFVPGDGAGHRRGPRPVDVLVVHRDPHRAAEGGDEVLVDRVAVDARASDRARGGIRPVDEPVIGRHSKMGCSAPVMKFGLAFVPSRLARPIVRKALFVQKMWLLFTATPHSL